MADSGPGYRHGMADREHTKQPVEELRAVDTKEVPEEEGVSNASAAETLDVSAEEQPNRPEQAGFSPEERKQYNDPPVESAGPYDAPVDETEDDEDADDR